MNKYQICQATIEIYTEFFRQVTYNKNYVFSKFKADILQVSRFADWLLSQYKPEQIGIDFLIDFFKFQFSRYAGINTQYGRNAIMIHWLIGKKAQGEWKNQKHSKRWMVNFKLSKTVEIRLRDAFKKQINSENLKRSIKRLTKLHLHEETEKMRYFDTMRGFIHCMGMTTLFNPASLACQQCKFNQNCQSVMKKQSPKLFKIRIGNE